MAKFKPELLSADKTIEMI